MLSRHAIVGIALALLVAPLPAQTTYPILKLQVNGNERLPTQALVDASGFALGRRVSPDSFAQVCGNLQATGLIEWCQYGYAPASSGGQAGIALTVDLREFGDLVPAVLDVPGQDKEALWEGLARWNGLLQRKLPGNEAASKYYVEQLQTYLAEQGSATKLAVEPFGLTNEELKLLFQPAELAAISSVRFAGDISVSRRALDEAMRRVAIGAPYTPRRMQQYLDFNVLPIFERAGRLKTRFTSVRATPSGSASSLDIAVEIDQGAVYQLTGARVEGYPGHENALLSAADFPIGKPANWTLIQQGLLKMQDLLGESGYLTAQAGAKRVFDDANRAVSLAVSVRPGSVFTFGELILLGLETKAQERARKRWELASGDPMNAAYVRQYLRNLSSSGVTAGLTVGQELKVRSGTHVVDVQLVFR